MIEPLPIRDAVYRNPAICSHGQRSKGRLLSARGVGLRIDWRWLVVVVCLFGWAESASAQFDFEGPPIRYRQAATDNAITRLEARLRSGETELVPDRNGDYLASLLAELEIPVSSQTLVFSKTSLQQSRIGPSMPRAIYFNDECYVGWVQGGVIEIGVVDERLGGIFYTYRGGTRNVSFNRDRGACLGCHATGKTQRVPGFLVRSIYPDAEGRARDLGFVTDHRSPFAERWGGWYVSGLHGSMRHLGNELALDPDDDEKIDVERGANRVTLDDHFDTSKYLTPHSDLIALLVMEHQSQMHNFITLARYETLRALDTGEPTAAAGDADPVPPPVSDEAMRRIAAAGDRLIEFLLFCDEPRLTSPVSGTSGFDTEFAALGPFDSQDRSLRQFDLQTRLFRYPCSYLIYSPAFAALPEPMLDYVRGRLTEILRGEVSDDRFDHLSGEDRQAILEILTETMPSWFPAG